MPRRRTRRGCARAAAGLAAALACVVPAAGAVPTGDPVFGDWLVGDGQAIIEVAPCGSEACGRIVWVAKPGSGNEHPMIDTHNPDPALRNRPICGLTILTGLARQTQGRWTGGHIYNVETGRTYGFEATAGPAGRTLDIRGYLGLPILGETRTWERVPDDRGGCAGAEASGESN